MGNYRCWTQTVDEMNDLFRRGEYAEPESFCPFKLFQEIYLEVVFWLSVHYVNAVWEEERELSTTVPTHWIRRLHDINLPHNVYKMGIQSRPKPSECFYWKKAPHWLERRVSHKLLHRVRDASRFIWYHINHITAIKNSPLQVYYSPLILTTGRRGRRTKFSNLFSKCVDHLGAKRRKRCRAMLLVDHSNSC